LGEFMGKTFAKGLSAGVTTAVMRGGRVSATQVAADAFGNALGESLAGTMGQTARSSSSSGEDVLGDFIARSNNWAGVSATPTFAEDRTMRDLARNPRGLPTSSATQLISDQGWAPTGSYGYAGSGDGITNWQNNVAAPQQSTVHAGAMAGVSDPQIARMLDLANRPESSGTWSGIGSDGVPRVQFGVFPVDDGSFINEVRSGRTSPVTQSTVVGVDLPPLGAGGGRGFVNPALAGLSTAERAGLIALGGKDAVVSAAEAAGYSYGLVGTPQARADWAIRTVDAGIAGMRNFFGDPKSAVSGWWSDLNSNDPRAVREASAAGSGVALGIGGGIVAGRLVGPSGSTGVAGLRQTGAGGLAGAADEAYALIRASETDVAAIAQNTGIKASNIQKVKDHLFYNEHLLDRYESLGIPGEMKRFDSNLDIADAWKRLSAGTFTEFDKQLLRHETAEAWYMKKYGPSYNNSHNAAQQRYPSPLE